MTPNPNPSPELREDVAILRSAVRRILARCEAVEDENSDQLGKDQTEASSGFLRGERSLAKSIRRELHDLTRAALSPQTLPAPGEVEDKPLLLRIALSEVASCSCNTKTDEARYHDSQCLYRVLRDAQAEIERLTKLSDKYFWQVRDTCARAENAEASLATVAAANDEGVAKAIEAAAKVCDDLASTAASIQAAIELSGGEAPIKNAQRETAETLSAAIRLLSQGGGK